MELNLYDIAVVILKNNVKPTMARGLRGTAGSGKGVRTLLEHFSLSLCYDYNAPENHTDLLLTTKPPNDMKKHITVSKKYWNNESDNNMNNDNNNDNNNNNSSYYDNNNNRDDIGNMNYDRKKASVDFDIGRLELFSVPIPFPTAIQPLQLGSKMPFGDAPCSIVLSYEDLLYTLSLVKEFIGQGNEGKIWKCVEKRRDNRRERETR